MTPDDRTTAVGPLPASVTRRTLLATIGSSVATGVAGCLRTGDSDAIDESVADDPTVFALPFPYLSEAAQLNPWSGSYPWSIHALFFETPLLTTPTYDHHATDLIEDVEHDGTTVTVSYSDAFTWWNGEPVTARDRWVQERIDAFVRDTDVDVPLANELGETEASHRLEFERRLGTDVTAITLENDYALTYEFDRPLARPLAVARALRGAHNVAAWRFEPWVERLADAGSAGARADLVTELRETTLPLEEASDEGYGCGPYELVEVSPNRLLLDRFVDHPRATALSIPRLWLPIAMDQKTDELVARGFIDGQFGRLETLRVDPPEHLEQLAEYRTNGGMKLVLNWRNRHLARRNVRRALVCVLSIDELAAQGEWGTPATTQTGLTAPLEERWLGETILEDLHRYPVEADEERAASYMRAAGYTHDGEFWRDGDGDRVRLRLRTPMWDGWLAATELLKIELAAFGIDVEIVHVPDNTFFAFVEQGDFELLPWWTDGHPYRAYDLADRDLATLGYDLETADDEPRFGKPIEPNVPRRPGDVHADDGGRERVDLTAQWRRIREPSSDAETADAVATVARWWNDDLPDIDLTTGVTGVWGNTREFTWPDSGDSRYDRTGADNRPELELLKTGAIGLRDLD